MSSLLKEFTQTHFFLVPTLALLHLTLFSPELCSSRGSSDCPVLILQWSLLTHKTSWCKERRAIAPSSINSNVLADIVRAQLLLSSAQMFSEPLRHYLYILASWALDKKWLAQQCVVGPRLNVSSVAVLSHLMPGKLPVTWLFFLFYSILLSTISIFECWPQSNFPCSDKRNSEWTFLLFSFLTIHFETRFKLPRSSNSLCFCQYDSEGLHILSAHSP